MYRHLIMGLPLCNSVTIIQAPPLWGQHMVMLADRRSCAKRVDRRGVLQIGLYRGTQIYKNKKFLFIIYYIKINYIGGHQ